MSSPIIRLEAATRNYEGPPAVCALDEVELVVEHGEHVAVVGPSGSGKSTMLGILGLLDRLDLGRYLFDGIDTTALGERDLAALRAQRIGFVFQAFHLLPHRSVEDNVAMSGMYRHLNRRQRRRCAVDALDRVGLAHRRTQTASTLSGGERQRVAIARAVSTAPSLLLCDEPTGNLDADNTEAVLDLLADLSNDGITIVTITHDPNVSVRADRTVRLVDGRTLELVPEMSQ